MILAPVEVDRINDAAGLSADDLVRVFEVDHKGGHRRHLAVGERVDACTGEDRDLSCECGFTGAFCCDHHDSFASFEESLDQPVVVVGRFLVDEVAPCDDATVGDEFEPSVFVAVNFDEVSERAATVDHFGDVFVFRWALFPFDLCARVGELGGDVVGVEKSRFVVVGDDDNTAACEGVGVVRFPFGSLAVVGAHRVAGGGVAEFGESVDVFFAFDNEDDTVAFFSGEHFGEPVEGSFFDVDSILPTFGAGGVGHSLPEVFATVGSSEAQHL